MKFTETLVGGLLEIAAMVAVAIILGKIFAGLPQ